MSGPFMRLGYGGGGQAHGGNAGAITGAGGQVTGHGEGIRRQVAEAHLVASAFEDTPLGAVDPAGVVREDGLQCIGHGFVGGPQLRQGRGPMGDYLLVAGAHGRAFGDILVSITVALCRKDSCR